MGFPPLMFGSFVSAIDTIRTGRPFRASLSTHSNSPAEGNTADTKRYRPPVTAESPASVHRTRPHRPSSRASKSVSHPAASLGLSVSRLK